MPWLHLHLQFPKDRTLPCYDPEVHKDRLNIILDAVASICVSQPNDEVYSTAMELVSGPTGRSGYSLLGM